MQAAPPYDIKLPCFLSPTSHPGMPLGCRTLLPCLVQDDRLDQWLEVPPECEKTPRILPSARTVTCLSTSDEALESHMNSHIHADDYSKSEYVTSEEEEGVPYCNRCERLFIDMSALNQRIFAPPKHNWRFDCSHDLASPTSLDQHQHAFVHEGRVFKCFFCRWMFKSPSGIAHHIESQNMHAPPSSASPAHPSAPKTPLLPPRSPPTSPSLSPPPPPSTAQSTHASSADAFSLAWAGSTRSSTPPHTTTMRSSGTPCTREFTLISGFVLHLKPGVRTREACFDQWILRRSTERFSRLL
ncbi:hypothetical protein BDN70DRAFT_995205 [Pholiota conissans]|uniref:C2H2-type domain-containing protein n=1 Tax=Pholiota conissans TaxID=109636 RepID=A0A9P6CYY5_9AGAR|nr:hypothetical protein BDN70DRAFT_995205 [Pholiota conissans]